MNAEEEENAKIDDAMQQKPVNDEEFMEDANGSDFTAANIAENASGSGNTPANEFEDGGFDFRFSTNRGGFRYV